MDVEGNTYKTVKIGDQEWMAENLRTTKYSNGDDIPDGTLAGDYSAETEPKYRFTPEAVDTMGYLYTWFVVNDSRDVCPTGWHVPSDAEFVELEVAIGLSQLQADVSDAWRGQDDSIDLKLKSKYMWTVPGTDEFGFNAVPVGYWNPVGELRASRGSTEFWSSTAGTEAGTAAGRKIHNDVHGIFRDPADRDAKRGWSVRCVKAAPSYETGEIKDVEDNTYKTVKIGEQWWMAENLRTTKYSNGDDIPDGTTVGDYTAETEPKYRFSPEAIDTMGYLYTWYVATDSKNVCPTGWHIPSDAEFIELEVAIGLSQLQADVSDAWRGQDDSIELKIKSAYMWTQPGTDDFGFNAVPVGYWNPVGELRASRGSTEFWSSTAGTEAGTAAGRKIHNDVHGIFRDPADRDATRGWSVRCLKDTESPTYETGEVKDVEDNTYLTVKIGEQWWMAENLRTTKYSNGDDIPDGTSAGDYSSESEPKYRFTPESVDTMGYLYTWYVASDSRNVCPTDWHIPSDAEFIELEVAIGLSQLQADVSDAWRGQDDSIELKIKSAYMWTQPGTDDFGFNAVPVGYWNPVGELRASRGSTEFWSSIAGTEAGTAAGRKIHNDVHGIFRDPADRDAKRGWSLRCVKDEVTAIRQVYRNAFDVNVYPNPTSDMFTISVPDNKVKYPIEVHLYDITGKRLESRLVHESESRFSLGNYPRSVYILKVIDLNEKVDIIKVIKK